MSVKGDDRLLSVDEVSVTVNDNALEGFHSGVLHFISATGKHVGIEVINEGNLTCLKVVDPENIPNTFHFHYNRRENTIYCKKTEYVLVI